MNEWGTNIVVVLTEHQVYSLYFISYYTIGNIVYSTLSNIDPSQIRTFSLSLSSLCCTILDYVEMEASLQATQRKSPVYYLTWSLWEWTGSGNVIGGERRVILSQGFPSFRVSWLLEARDVTSRLFNIWLPLQPESTGGHWRRLSCTPSSLPSSCPLPLCHIYNLQHIFLLSLLSLTLFLSFYTLPLILHLWSFFLSAHFSSTSPSMQK